MLISLTNNLLEGSCILGSTFNMMLVYYSRSIQIETILVLSILKDFFRTYIGYERR